MVIRPVSGKNLETDVKEEKGPLHAATGSRYAAPQVPQAVGSSGKVGVPLFGRKVEV